MSADKGRGYWERHAKRYGRSTRFLSRPVPRMLVVPTYLHGETLGAAMLSRLFALTGFPGKRRFTAASLREAIEGAGMDVRRAELIPGPFPIGYVEAAIR